MTEHLIRDHAAEEKRLRDRVDDANRFGRIESDHAVLRTRFEAAVKRFEEALERAVSPEDLKELKREWETNLRDAISGFREHVSLSNKQQETSILGQVQTMLATDRLAAAEDQKNFRRQISLTLLAWGLGIVTTVFILWLTTRAG